MRPFPPTLETRTSAIGLSAFTTEDLDVNEPILEFSGPVYGIDDLDDPLVLARCVQIGPDTYLDPRGDVSGHVNHSCDPNCAVIVEPERVLLIALRRIRAGEEIAYDYSTMMVGRTRRIDACRCGAFACRGTIVDYVDLPDDVRARYERLEAVPKYVLHHFGLAARVLVPDPKEPRYYNV